MDLRLILESIDRVSWLHTVCCEMHAGKQLELNRHLILCKLIEFCSNNSRHIFFPKRCDDQVYPVLLNHSFLIFIKHYNYKLYIRLLSLSYK